MVGPWPWAPRHDFDIYIPRLVLRNSIKTGDITSMKKLKLIFPLEDINKILKDSEPKQNNIVEDIVGKDISGNVFLNKDKGGKEVANITEN